MIRVIDGVDLFAGGGGASLGLKLAGILMTAALNHNQNAVASHAVNFPEALHFCRDVRDPKATWGLPKAKILWASPDCTHHSGAAGGRSRSEDSRALAEEVLRFAYETDAWTVWIENVSEFKDWGPVTERRDAKGDIIYKRDKKTGELQPEYVPIKARKAEYYLQWVAAMKAMGYANYEYRIINAADHGGTQTRERYFGIFTRRGIPIVWPTPTHDKEARFGRLPWNPVRPNIDLTDRGRSIFNRTRTSKKRGVRWDALKDKTLKRIEAGLWKHVINSATPRPWLRRATSNAPSGKPNPDHHVDQPSATVATQYLPSLVSADLVYNPAWGGHFGTMETPSCTVVARQDKAPLQLIAAEMMFTHYGNAQWTSPEAPCPAVVTNPKTSVVSFLSKAYSGDPRHMSVGLQQPAGTITTVDHHQKITVEFAMQYNGGSDDCRNLALEGPINTLTTENRFGLISAFMHQNNGGEQRNRTLDRSAFTATATGGQQYLVATLLMQNNSTRHDPGTQTYSLDLPARTLTTNGGNQMLMTYYNNAGHRPLEQPAATVLTRDTLALVSTEGFTFSHQYSNLPRAFSEPARTLVASRRHPYVVFVEPGQEHLLPHPLDTDQMRHLKAVCREHGIADIKMRLLKVRELARIQGFPDWYYLQGTITEQKKMIGNAVHVAVARAIGMAMLPVLEKVNPAKLPKLKVSHVKRWEQLWLPFAGEGRVAA